MWRVCPKEPASDDQVEDSDASDDQVEDFDASDNQIEDSNDVDENCQSSSHNSRGNLKILQFVGSRKGNYLWNTRPFRNLHHQKI